MKWIDKFFWLLILLSTCLGCASAHGTGIPKGARKHCEEEASKLIREKVDPAVHGDVKACLFIKLMMHCEEAMYRHASELERQAGRDILRPDPWFFYFPGEWDRTELDEMQEMRQEAFDFCGPAVAKAQALKIFMGLGIAAGAVDWPRRGVARPGMCKGCPAQ